MCKKLIDDVQMPVDAKVNFDDAVIALKRRGCKEPELSYLCGLMKGKDIYDFSGYSGITTIIISSNNPNEMDLCIKICDKPKGLYENVVIMNLMSKYHLLPRGIQYISSNKDYLITERIVAPMAVNAYSDFRSLAEFMGSSLRSFHDISWEFKNMLPEEIKILTSRSKAIFSEALKHEKGLEFLARYQADYDYSSMKQYLKEHEFKYCRDEVIIHGDYNPRNVFVKNHKIAGLVDFTDTCLGDRHYDIYFSMWTVALYTGIVEDKHLVEECEKIFLDAYGRDKIDEDRMELCKKLTCMYWQEHNEINMLI